MSLSNTFLRRNKEKSEFNQYWYSSHTIDAVVAEIESCFELESEKREGSENSLAPTAQNSAFTCAFLSTPSIHFSLKNQEIFKGSLLLDYDDKSFARRCKDCHFYKYDFNEDVEKIPEEYKHQFRYLVVDPPFITREVWEKYARAIEYLAAPGAKILCSTIQENREIMKELLQCDPVAFKPSIPNLVYQYFFYTNYGAVGPLGERNVEIPED